MRVQSLEALEKAASASPRNWKLILKCANLKSEAARLSEMSGQFQPAARGGEVRLLLPLDDRNCEMELVLPGRYVFSQQEIGRFSCLPFVEEIIEA
jgi:DNA polymerase-3 subunit alpha